MFQKKAAASDPVAFIQTRLKIELTENKNELFIKVTTNKIVKNS
jgi:hypothetical protein